MKSLILVLFPTVFFIGALFSYLKLKQITELQKEENKKWLIGLSISLIILMLLTTTDYITSSLILKNTPEQKIELSEVSKMNINETDLIEYNNKIYRANIISSDEYISIKEIPQKQWGIFGASTINISEYNYSKINNSL